jgi:hypothetical protein
MGRFNNLVPSIEEVMSGKNPEGEQLIHDKLEQLKNSQLGQAVINKLKPDGNPSILHDVVLPTVSQSLDLLGKPQQGYQMMANYATGNDINSNSYTPAIKTLNSKLPEMIQASPEMVNSAGMVMDLEADPLGAIGSIGKVRNPGRFATILNKEAHNAEEIGKMMKRPYKNFGDTAVLKTAQEAAEDAQKLAMQKGAEQYLAKQEARKAAKSMPNQVSTQLSAFDQWVTQNPGKSKQDYLSEMLSKK